MIGMFKVQDSQELEGMHFYLFICFYFVKIRPQLFVVDSALISKLYYQNETHIGV